MSQCHSLTSKKKKHDSKHQKSQKKIIDKNIINTQKKGKRQKKNAKEAGCSQSAGPGTSMGNRCRFGDF